MLFAVYNIPYTLAQSICYLQLSIKKMLLLSQWWIIYQFLNHADIFEFFFLEPTIKSKNWIIVSWIISNQYTSDFVMIFEKRQVTSSLENFTH